MIAGFRLLAYPSMHFSSISSSESSMPSGLNRRDVLTTALAGAFAAVIAGRPDEAAATPLTYGPAKPFSYAQLVKRAQEMAKAPYVAPYKPAPSIVEKIDYDAHGKIRFKRDYSMFVDGDGLYPVSFFHLGRFFGKSVKMHAIEGDKAREVMYSGDYFDMPPDSPARGLPPDAGFAGFQLRESKARPDWKTQDWVAFLGASYFRAIGALNQYGISARGLAIDVAAPNPEEFPDFSEFYIQPATAEGAPVVIHALLTGPSIAGAFKFAIRRTEGCVMDIESALFVRKDIFRLGIAPLTSMFWYGEYNRPAQFDWRPEVHDSDGLGLITGAGERIFRPLNNPGRILVNSFVDSNPRGFGLVQRDRNNENYLDGVNYERRPTLWVEPIGGWGEGSVQLVEIPTDDEIHDNIVAMWVPKNPVKAGDSFDFKYRLHWVADEPFAAANLAKWTALRVGRGGQAGRDRPKGYTKFVLEYGGDALAALAKDAKMEPVITVSRGKTSYVFIEPVPWTKRHRLHFDVQYDGDEPIDMRAYVKVGDNPVTETWLYQLLPGALGEGLKVPG